jgi:hypothetical protein
MMVFKKNQQFMQYWSTKEKSKFTDKNDIVVSTPVSLWSESMLVTSDNAELLQFYRLAVQHSFHLAKIKVLAELHSI